MDLKEKVALLDVEMADCLKQAAELEAQARAKRARHTECKVERQEIHVAITKLVAQQATENAAAAAQASAAAAEAAQKDAAAAKAETDKLNEQIRERIAALDEMLAKAKTDNDKPE